ncbi:ERF118 protein [Hibiscus syriacus]|uniref:ERF118 protein n=1 Tax=Hibiscus syriacus TaxID=106335 RepID=A0A6A2YFR1_HIBSY|nr:ERF118 protein [Hibiscus syriacus]
MGKGVDGGSRRGGGGKRAEGGESTAVAEEEEVEEFFAILKRIRVAVKYFEKVKGGGGKVTTGNQWRPSFVLEDFDGDKNQEDSKEDKGLDLNLKPAVSKQDN